MKYYLRDKHGVFLRWNDKIIYFQCWLDAVAFLDALNAIDWLEWEGVIIEPSKSQLFLPIDTVDMTGLIPIANGDSIELKEYDE